jgi:hypothetical protein
VNNNTCNSSQFIFLWRRNDPSRTGARTRELRQNRQYQNTRNINSRIVPTVQIGILGTVI